MRKKRDSGLWVTESVKQRTWKSVPVLRCRPPLSAQWLIGSLCEWGRATVTPEGLVCSQLNLPAGRERRSFHRKPELLLTYIQWWHSHPHKPSAPKKWPAQSTWSWPKQELNQSWVWLKRQHNSLNPDRFTAYLSAHNANESSLPKRSSVISQQSAIIKLKPGS